TGPFHRTPLVEAVPIRRPSSSNRWTSRSSRRTTAAWVWGAPAITRHAPPQRTAYSPARKSFPGARRVRRSRRLTAGSWIRRKGTEAWAPSEQVLLHERGIPTGVAADGGDGSGVPGERFDRLFVGGVGEQHRVRPRVEGEPHRQPLLPRPLGREDHRQGFGQQVAERRIRGEAGGVHAPGVALGECPQGRE